MKPKRSQIKGARGKSENARRHFGQPPKDCPKCHRMGGVIDTRVMDRYVWRRHVCKQNHKWSSVEILVTDLTQGPGGPSGYDLAMRDLRREMMKDLIDRLREWAL